MDTPSQQNLNQLPIGSPLGDFTITGIVGEGGFGIVYLAYEAALDRVVAIKEYLPSSIAGRTGNQSVMVRSQLNNNAFASGLKNFLREAQMLAKFSHPALVEVHRVWEQNSTAYMAMRYYEGKTLREWRLANDDFDEARIRRLLEPVMDALSLLHAQNVIHRDVSPDNILMRGSGTPVLLDLGAARLVIGGMTQALTTILKPGYAPIEQYVDDGTMHQGPWTDVYGLGAVLYYMLTGVAPPQAVARMITDPIRNMSEKVKVSVSPAFIEAVIAALAVRPENRFQSVDDLRDGLGWTEPLPAEPRTQYARTEYATRGASLSTPTAGGVKSGVSTTPITKGAAPVTSPGSQPLATAYVRPPAAPPAASTTSVSMPAMNVVIPAQPVAATTPASASPSVDDDKTVIWNAAAVAAATRTAADRTSSPPAKTTPQSGPKAESATNPSNRASTPPPPAASPIEPRAASIAAARASSYGDTAATAGNSKSKIWVFAALATVLAAAGGYFFINRGPGSAPAVATLPPTAQVDAPNGVSASPPLIVTPAAPMVATAPVPTPASPMPTPAPVKAAPAPVSAAALTPAAGVTKPVPENKEAARLAEEEKAAKAKREAQDKAKAEALEKAAKTKAESDERVRKLKQEAEDRAAAVRADQEEKARRAREEEDRLAAAKARQDAERQKSASPPPATGGLVVTPPRRTVEELSAAGNAAFKRNEVAVARAAWNELVGHPEATARSKAIAYNNLAVSYCQNSDETNCERMYASMLRADRAYGAEVSERELPQFKRAYERAARQLRVPGY